MYASDNISPDMKPPPISDGTPNESVADVFVRVTQLMSILETQYSGETVVIVSPDSDNLSILQAGLIGLDLRRLQLVNFLLYSEFIFTLQDLSLVIGKYSALLCGRSPIAVVEPTLLCVVASSAPGEAQ